MMIGPVGPQGRFSVIEFLDEAQAIVGFVHNPKDQVHEQDTWRWLIMTPSQTRLRSPRYGTDGIPVS